MNSSLYDEVNSLAIDIVNASNLEDETAMARAYKLLAELCITNHDTNRDHPLQWEALGDFSDDFKSTVEAYEKGLACAIKLELNEYSASISLALSEAHLEQNKVSKAKELIMEAKDFAKTISDVELKAAIDTLASQL